MLRVLQDLMTEIQLLRQMLADANEEKTIQVQHTTVSERHGTQCNSMALHGCKVLEESRKDNHGICNFSSILQVAIVRDEVVEKQEQVQELTRQKSELEAGCAMVLPFQNFIVGSGNFIVGSGRPCSEKPGPNLTPWMRRLE